MKFRSGLKDGCSFYRIAKTLNRSYNTIKQEIARGMVPLYDGNVRRYKAEAGQRNYEERRSHCRKQCLETAAFIRYGNSGK